MGKDSVDDRPSERQESESKLAEIEFPVDDNEASKMALGGENKAVSDGQVAFSATSERNGDAKIDIDTSKVQFCGMSKEELMKYANDPFWVRLRWAFFILFWLAWLTMLVGAIVIIVLAPKCQPVPSLYWWQEETVYQVYPRSFKDAKGDDGVGDLSGIMSKLDYLKDLAVKTVWVNPIYKSPMKDMGYDVSDYSDIDPIFGTLDDFNAFVKALDAKDMHLVMDFVPNHSSDQHEWFQKSVQKEDDFTDYYVWADGKTDAGDNRQPPNNWKSVFGGSAWEWNDARQQYYYHQFMKEQPDLNFRNHRVVEEMNNVLRFWLDKGVDGFRIDAINHLVESSDLSKDEPLLPGKPADSENYADYDHVYYTTHLPETLDILQGWRKVVDSYEEKDSQPRILLAEVYAPLDQTMDYYGNGTKKLADYPFNFELLNKLTNAADLTPVKVSDTIKSWLNAMPDGAWANWVIGNHDNSRVATRLGSDYVDAMNMISVLLPGTSVTYYGEELGMTDTTISDADVQDLSGSGRDPERTPMQWDDSEYAGFSTAKPWLPVNSNYMTVNVKAQKTNMTSHLNIYKKLIELKSGEAGKFGNVSFPLVTTDVFSFMRVKAGSAGYLVLINFGDAATVLDLSIIKDLPPEATVVTRSMHATNDTTKPKSKVLLTDVPVGSHEGLVLKFVAPESE